MIEGRETQEAADHEGGAERLLNTLRRRANLVIACLFLVAAFAVVASLLQEKQYTADASLLFRDPGYAQGVFGSDTAVISSTDPARQAATNIQLVGLHVVGARTAAALGEELTAEEVAGKVQVSGQGLSDVVSVAATDSDPEMARVIANTFAREFIAFRADADRTKLLAAKRLADQEFNKLDASDKNGPRGEQLSRGAERLGILASLQTGNAELVQPAETPSSPSSPKPFRNGIIGIFLGLVLGVVLAFVLERFNRQIRVPDEAEEAFGLPILGAVPESKAIGDAEGGASPLPFAEEESFRMLRASLRYFSVDHEIRTVLVTSSSAQAGKTTTAWNLARVAAKTSKVALLETDLRNPSIVNNFPSLAGPGLAQILTHQLTLESAIQEVQLGKEGVIENGGGPAKLSVITAGSVPPNPAELIESQGMADVIAQLAERFDFVVVDTAPIGVVSDSFPLMSKVDGVVIVARMEKTSRDSAEDLRDQLKRLQAPVLGVVANGIKVGRRGKYGYGYGYGYYGQTPETESSEKQPSKTS